MSQWQVLDLGGDPAPGDPDRTRALAQRLLDQAELVENNTSRLRSVTGSSDALRMAGDYAPTFREILSELPGELSKLSTAYRRCGEALSAFATRLAEAKSQAGNALRQGQDAHGTIQGAVRQVQAALPPDVAVSERQVVSRPLLEAAIAAQDENLKAQVRPIARRAQFTEADRQRARRLPRTPPGCAATPKTPAPTVSGRHWTAPGPRTRNGGRKPGTSCPRRFGPGRRSSTCARPSR